MTAEESHKITENTKVSEHLVLLQSPTIVQDLTVAHQHQQSVNSVAVDVEVQYNESSINNNTGSTSNALDMAKITAGAPGINTILILLCH